MNAVMDAIDDLLEDVSLTRAATTPTTTRTIQDQPCTRDLLNIALDALKIRPPLYFSSFFGRPLSWLPPHRRFSEFKIIDIWNLRRMVHYLTNITVPALPLTPPPFSPPLVENFFWSPTVILQRPDHNGSYTTFPREAWFFINGILTDDTVAQMNAAYLSYLFHRPITLIQNATDSFPVDMLECILGKEWQRTMEPTTKAVPIIYDALKRREIEKVVVVAHSQGTIIMGNVLCWLYSVVAQTEALEDEEMATAECFAPPEFIYPDQGDLDPHDFEGLTIDELRKLEVYSFANCANKMPYFDAPTQTPWLEHFGNEFDIVARLGMQAPRQDKWGINIEGPCYIRRGGWGHLLNAHYLFPLADAQKRGRKQGGQGNYDDPFAYKNIPGRQESLSPRLYDYINGGSPFVFPAF